MPTTAQISAGDLEVLQNTFQSLLRRRQEMLNSMKPQTSQDLRTLFVDGLSAGVINHLHELARNVSLRPTDATGSHFANYADNLVQKVAAVCQQITV